MERIFAIGASLSLGVALVASVALAIGPGFGPWSGQSFGPGPGPGFSPRFRGPIAGVPLIQNLTSEQSEKIQALRASFLKDIEPLQRELFQKQTELR